MPFSRRVKTVLFVSAGVLVLAAVGVFVGWNGRVATNAESLLKRLPTQDAAIVGIDFGALRRGGLLTWLDQNSTPEEAEYTTFVRETGFNYKRDLDSVLASFAPDGEFFLVTGTFDWPRLEQYVIQQKGSCFGHLCRMAGSSAERNISFFPLSKKVLAMAVAPDDAAAARLEKPGAQSDVDVPRDPVWVTLSAGALRGSRNLPEQTRLLASAASDASRVTLTAGPSGDAFEARLDAICRDAQQASALTAQLRNLTAMLRDGSKQSATPDSSGLGALLLAGTFQQSGTHVYGRWPIGREFLSRVAAP